MEGISNMKDTKFKVGDIIQVNERDKNIHHSFHYGFILEIIHIKYNSEVEHKYRIVFYKNNRDIQSYFNIDVDPYYEKLI